VKSTRWSLLVLSILLVSCAPQPAADLMPTAAEEEPVSSTDIPLVHYDPPGWFQDTVVYEIFVRSFADSDGDGIGDLRGVEEQLDYLAALSIDAIWLMPVYPSPSVHGYDVIDPFDINPEYGTLQDLQSLVSAAHERDIHVILDFVPSHVSSEHAFFQDAYRNPDSVYTDWFVWTNDAHTTYATFAGVEEMPRLNHYNPEVVDYLVEAALFWMDLDDDGDMTDGIDGFRIDNATFPPQELFIELRQALKAANPDVLLLGEAWLHNPTDLSRFFPDQFDALFDFPIYELLQGDPTSNGDGLLAGNGFPALLTSLLAESEDILPDDGFVVRFFNNHDTNRIRSEVRDNEARIRLAARLLVSLPGPIMLYYGEEIGMPGQKGGAPYYDNYRREPMDWYAGEEGEIQTTWFTPEDGWNQPSDGISVEEQEGVADSVLNEYRQLLALRADHPAMQIGSMTFLDLDASARGPLGYVLETEEETLIAVFNFGDEPSTVRIPSGEATGCSFVDLFSGLAAGPVVAEGYLVLELDPAGSVLLSCVEEAN